MKYHIWTIGCQMNEADSRHLATQLEGLGLESTRDFKIADVIVLNTCVVRQRPEDKAIGRLMSLKSLKRKNPDLVIALMGCLVGYRESADLQAKFPFVDVFMSPSTTAPLIDLLIQRLGKDGSVSREQLLQDYRLPAQEVAKSVLAYVPITLGCSHVCSYCVIPHRRGPDRSRSPEKILREVETLVSQGVREIGLLGQIVDRYGLDLDEDRNLAWLLRKVAGQRGVERVRFLTNHPAYMDENLIETVAQTPHVCPHFELPVQAGNDRILKEMRRGHTASEFVRIVDRIRERVPQAAINTDVIVGYPSESRAEFMETYNLLRDLRLDLVHIAKYSPRPGTRAARQTDDVPAEEKEERRVMLDQLVKRILSEKHARLAGDSVEVLVEGFQERTGRWRSRTPQGDLVFFESSFECLGKLVRVKIDWTGPYSMLGRPLSETREVASENKL